MPPSTYFLVNDTRYDNHHGGLAVIRNLHLGMERRGWRCVGSLPVSATVRRLGRQRRPLRAAQRIIVNGEGTLHHDSRNAGRLLALCDTLARTHPVCLVNAVWQDNDAARWQPVLERLARVYARDRRSQRQLQALGTAAGYAPDLTFYDYPRFAPRARTGYGCTDSVLSAWTRAALRACARDAELHFHTLFTGDLRHVRGVRDWSKRVKYRLYPWLRKNTGLRIPPRYQALLHAEKDFATFLETMASRQAVCVARYHGLCFALQQQIPFLAAASNSHKSEALLEEIGLPLEPYLIKPADLDHLKDRLARAARDYPLIEPAIAAFNRAAQTRLEQMFDDITGAL
ncbi:MAG: polysaccharide pyruvyl transferase family protein [Candidatus Marinimicrobia bacterium]|nr:polysaccharide pyruvyl transferase family protein [Candidatus Neomarinimicrobiota bacterium]